MLQGVTLIYVVILVEGTFLGEILLAPVQLISMFLGSTGKKKNKKKKQQPWCSSSFNFYTGYLIFNVNFLWLI